MCPIVNIMRHSRRAWAGCPQARLGLRWRAASREGNVAALGIGMRRPSRRRVPVFVTRRASRSGQAFASDRLDHHRGVRRFQHPVRRRLLHGRAPDQRRAGVQETASGGGRVLRQGRVRRVFADEKGKEGRTQARGIRVAVGTRIETALTEAAAHVYKTASRVVRAGSSGVERGAHNALVTGSNPVRPTTGELTSDCIPNIGAVSMQIGC